MSSADTTGEAADATPDHTEPSVLLIEDDPDLLELYDQILARSDGYDVRTAANGIEGLELLNETTDLVVMDWKLPQISGSNLVTQIRDDRPDIPLVVVSGLDPSDGFDVASMIDEVVRKPISADDLEDLIQTHLLSSVHCESPS